MNPAFTKGRFGLRLAIIACFICCAETVFAQSPLVITYNLEKTNINAHLAYIEDVTGRLTIEDVTNTTAWAPLVTNASSKEARKKRMLGIRKGYTTSVYWARFTLSNETLEDASCYLVSELTPDYMTVFYHDAAGMRISKQLGMRLPLSIREVPHQDAIIPVTLPPEGNRTYYLRVKTERSLAISLTLWEHKAYHEWSHVHQFLLGLFFGLVGIMIVYNLHLFVFIKDKLYLFYSLAIGAYSFYLFEVNGLAYRYFYAENPDFFPNLAPFLGGLAMFLTTIFSQYLMESKRYVPRLHTLLWIFTIPAIVLMPLSLFAPYQVCGNVGNFGGILWSLVAIITAIAATVKGSKSALFYAIGHLCVYVGVALFSLRSLGIFNNDSIANNANKIGFAIEVLLLSLVVANRFNVLRKEKEHAQEESLENLEKVTRMQTDFLRTLEQRVEERTIQLQLAMQKAEAANRHKSKFLANMSHELRTPLNSINGIADLLRFGTYEKSEEIQKELSTLRALYEKMQKKLPHLNDVFTPFIEEASRMMTFLAEDSNGKRYLITQREREMRKRPYFSEPAVAKECREVETCFANLKRLINEEEKETFKAYAHIKDAGTYLLTLIDTVLNLSKVEAGNVEVTLHETDTRDLIESIIFDGESYLRSKEKEEKIALTYSIDASVPPRVFIDKQKVRQTLLNFISNAIKFSEKGTVRLRVEKNDTELTFSVSDEGIGIRKEETPLIFTEFGRTSITADLEGTGLGLALSKTLVELQGGTIGFSSKEGVGSRFWFSIPLV